MQCVGDGHYLITEVKKRCPLNVKVQLHLHYIHFRHCFLVLNSECTAVICCQFEKLKKRHNYDSVKVMQCYCQSVERPFAVAAQY